MIKYSVIILAAGSGSRTGLKRNKVFYEIKGKKVLDYSIEFFKSAPKCYQILLVVSEENFVEMKSLYNDQVDQIIIGGDTRQDSVFHALNHINQDFVLIHDAARPFLSKQSIFSLVEALKVEKCVTLAVPVKDTIQKVDGKRVVKTLDRSSLVRVQTPQGFETSILVKAHENAKKDGFIGTDDTSLVEKYLMIPAYVVTGDYRNIKLTTLDDIKFLEVVL